MVEKGLNV